MKDRSAKRSKQRSRHMAQDRKRRISRLIAKGMIASESDIPEDAIPIDPDCSTKALTWSPQVYYRDLEFACSDCGKTEVWTAESQQYYFEIMRSSPYKGVKRCYDCRQKAVLRRNEAREKSGHGKPAKDA